MEISIGERKNHSDFLERKKDFDIAGPRTNSLGGSRCFTVMRCEATGFMWVFTHKTKDASADLVMYKIEVFLHRLWAHHASTARHAQDRSVSSRWQKSSVRS
jgi:hypothetical protein